MRQQYSASFRPGSGGLSAAEVAERVARGLVNDVPSAPTRTIGQILRANLLTRFNLLLGSLLAVILVVGPLQDALFGLVIVANTVVGVVQEVRAKRTLDRLEVVNAPRARVVRDGQVAELAVGQVVLDDVLEAAAGDQVVVDGEVLEAAGLEVDESLLTGESETVARRPGDRPLSGSFGAGGGGGRRLPGGRLRARGERPLPAHRGRPGGLRGPAHRAGPPLHPGPFRAAGRGRPKPQVRGLGAGGAG